MWIILVYDLPDISSCSSWSLDSIFITRFGLSALGPHFALKFWGKLFVMGREECKNALTLHRRLNTYNSACVVSQLALVHTRGVSITCTKCCLLVLLLPTQACFPQPALESAWPKAETVVKSLCTPAVIWRHLEALWSYFRHFRIVFPSVIRQQV